MAEYYGAEPMPIYGRGGIEVGGPLINERVHGSDAAGFMQFDSVWSQPTYDWLFSNNPAGEEILLEEADFIPSSGAQKPPISLPDISRQSFGSHNSIDSGYPNSPPASGDFVTQGVGSFLSTETPFANLPATTPHFQPHNLIGNPFVSHVAGQACSRSHPPPLLKTIQTPSSLFSETRGIKSENPITVESLPEILSHPAQSLQLKIHTTENEPTPKAEEDTCTDTAVTQTSDMFTPRRYPLRIKSKESSGYIVTNDDDSSAWSEEESAGSDSDQYSPEMEKMRAPKDIGNRPIHSSHSPQLWEFLMMLLDDPKKRSVIGWRNKEEGIFKIIRSDTAAYLWGEYKHRSNMNYDKMSRAMRYYYAKGIFEKIPGRLVYKFSQAARQKYAASAAAAKQTRAGSVSEGVKGQHFSNEVTSPKRRIRSKGKKRRESVAEREH